MRTSSSLIRSNLTFPELKVGLIFLREWHNRGMTDVWIKNEFYWSFFCLQNTWTVIILYFGKLCSDVWCSTHAHRSLLTWKIYVERKSKLEPESTLYERSWNCGKKITSLRADVIIYFNQSIIKFSPCEKTLFAFAAKLCTFVMHYIIIKINLSLCGLI